MKGQNQTVVGFVCFLQIRETGSNTKMLHVKQSFVYDMNCIPLQNNQVGLFSSVGKPSAVIVLLNEHLAAWVRFEFLEYYKLSLCNSIKNKHLYKGQKLLFVVLYAHHMTYFIILVYCAQHSILWKYCSASNWINSISLYFCCKSEAASADVNERGEIRRTGDN